jgi:hypothetical protein
MHISQTSDVGYPPDEKKGSCAAQEAVYLRRLFTSIGELQTTPTVLFEDNMSTQALANRELTVCSDRTKHIDVRIHYTTQLIVEGVIVLEHAATQFQLADVMTKDLDRVKFHYFVMMIMNRR